MQICILFYSPPNNSSDPFYSPPNSSSDPSIFMAVGQIVWQIKKPIISDRLNLLLFLWAILDSN